MGLRPHASVHLTGHYIILITVRYLTERTFQFHPQKLQAVLLLICTIFQSDPLLLSWAWKDPHAEEFEDKEGTFLIENESPSGRREAFSTSNINMKQYASPMPTQGDVKLKFKPLSKKVISATLQFSLSCIFLREGKATDEDMQSLASLMSMKQADTGNLDDFEEDNEDDEENRVNQEEKAAKITVLINKLNFWMKRNNSRSNPFVDPDATELNPFGDLDMEEKRPPSNIKEDPLLSENCLNPSLSIYSCTPNPQKLGQNP
uniref:EH domain-binding protein 1-like n=1 Tax=Podarcis muralis TaxID=64176 RepID=UPI0010A079E2|nr:EH domain-binding protein 1-like [Podarcis muralis]